MKNNYLNYKDVYHYMDLNEKDLKQQFIILNEFLTHCVQNKIKFTFLKPMPPCFSKHVSNIKKAVRWNNILAKDNVLINHNLYYSPNRKFYTYDKQNAAKLCHKCTHWRKKHCKGIPGRSFISFKNSFIKKHGAKVYQALRTDYENGVIVTGGKCFSNCKYCYERYIPDSILPRIKPLTIQEIKHFLFYKSKPASLTGVAHHSKGGDFFGHPDYKRIIKEIIKPPYVDHRSEILTNASFLDLDSIDFLAKYSSRISLYISVNSLNENIRNSLLNKHTSDHFSIKDILLVLKEKKLLAGINNIYTNQTKKEELHKLIAWSKDLDPHIQINFSRPGYNKYMPEQMHTMLNINFKDMLLNIYPLKKIRDKNITIDFDLPFDYFNFERNIHNGFRKRIIPLKKLSGQSILCLHTKNVSPFLKKDKYNHNIIFQEILPHTLGGNNDAAGHITIEDYLYVLKKYKKKYINNDIDCIAINKDTLDHNLRDLQGNDLNSIFHLTRNKLILA
ncbi:radical SAM protein [Candidatus Margulisiibacteriota bacterium]